MVVRGLVALTIYAASVASLPIIIYAGNVTRIAQEPIVTRYGAIVALSAGFGAVQLWRMPPQARRLFRSRQIALALGAAYGAILIAAIVTAVTPAAALSGALAATTALMIASRFVAYAMLRNKQSETTGETRAA